MFLINKTFIKPNKNSRILGILENLSLNSKLSQNELGNKTLLSGAMINRYLKDLQEFSLVQAVQVNGKSYKYELTKQGEEQRRQMLGQYMAEIVQIYSSLKDSIKQKIDYISSCGIKSLSLFGASETCEVVLSVLHQAKIQVPLVLDSDPNKQGRPFHGYIISPPSILMHAKPEAVLITSFAQHNEISKQIQDLHLENIRLFNL